MIPYGRQDIDDSDIEAVVETLRGDRLTQGPKIPQFENLVADFCGAKHAIAVANATAALHISCLALRIGTGDWLWTSPITFVASSNCGLYCGAQVDFVDIDPDTYNISIEALEAKLEVAEKNGKLPKVLVAVHLCGQSCDMRAIHALSQKYGFRIVEDASHAIGGEYRGKPIGNCEFSDITVFSFHPVKIITTGEGGLAVTNNPELATRLDRFRSHGITRDETLMTNEPDGPWYYQQLDLGYNYRLTDLQAALGISQLKRIEPFLAARRSLADYYNEKLSELPLRQPRQIPDSLSAWHLYVVRIQCENINKTHRQVFEKLRQAGIGVNLHYIPVHLQPYYAAMGFKQGDFPEAEKYYGEAISIPMFAAIMDDEKRTVVRSLEQILI